MMLTKPYAEELERIARRVMWFEEPVMALRDLRTFLAHLMVYGTAADVAIVEKYVGEEEWNHAD